MPTARDRVPFISPLSASIHSVGSSRCHGHVADDPVEGYAIPCLSLTVNTHGSNFMGTSSAESGSLRPGQVQGSRQVQWNRAINLLHHHAHTTAPRVSLSRRSVVWLGPCLAAHRVKTLAFPVYLPLGKKGRTVVPVQDGAS